MPCRLVRVGLLVSQLAFSCLQAVWPRLYGDALKTEADNEDRQLLRTVGWRAQTVQNCLDIHSWPDSDIGRKIQCSLFSGRFWSVQSADDLQTPQPQSSVFTLKSKARWRLGALRLLLALVVHSVCVSADRAGMPSSLTHVRSAMRRSMLLDSLCLLHFKPFVVNGPSSCKHWERRGVGAQQSVAFKHLPYPRTRGGAPLWKLRVGCLDDLLQEVSCCEASESRTSTPSRLLNPN